jgi:hypothetical protein
MGNPVLPYRPQLADLIVAGILLNQKRLELRSVWYSEWLLCVSFYLAVTRSEIRRFFCRPSSVLLSATG